MSAAIELVIREHAPAVLAILVRRYGGFAAAEDAVQEALIAAVQQWPDAGVPQHPRSWLVTAATRRLIDYFRSDHARHEREARHQADSARAGPALAPGTDDTLALLLLCCHPSLNLPAQVALTLRAVGGLTTQEIAVAFMVSESTMAQRISRAKARIRKTGTQFELPVAAELPGRLAAVMHTLYLIFNEGYTATTGSHLQRTDLSAEAIRLSRLLHRMQPDNSEAAGLLALMLLTDARRPARTTAEGTLVPLDEQDRSCWDEASIAEGTALISTVLPRGEVGPYQVQAAIAAVHDEAAGPESTDWAQIDQLYQVLGRLTPGPMVTLNRAVAVAMTSGPQAGLELIADLDDQLGAHHRLSAVRGHLLEMLGTHGAARAAYLTAADQAQSEPEREYLRERARRLG